jgi:hypothetical protein
MGRRLPYVSTRIWAATPTSDEIVAAVRFALPAAPAAVILAPYSKTEAGV